MAGRMKAAIFIDGFPSAWFNYSTINTDCEERRVAGADILIYCLFSFAAGCLATVVFNKFMSGESRQARDVERHLQETQDQLKTYQQEVSDHFEQTARLVDQLTESYREVHNHLADGAQNLLDLPGNQPIMKNLPDNAGGEPEVAASEGKTVEPPLDYAPKRTPYDKGMLDESFGIDKKAAPPEEQTAPPPTAA